MRILLLSIVNPASERNGASTVTRGLMNMLAQPPLQAKVDLIPVREEPVRFRRLAQARSLARSTLSGLPAKAEFVYSKDFGARVESRIRNNCYDLAILNGVDLVWIRDVIPASMPRILIAHNIEHHLYRTQIENLGRLYRPLQVLLHADCARLEAYEWNGMREVGKVVFLSHEEARRSADRCAGLRSITVPPVFDCEPVIRTPRRRGQVLELGLIGNFQWWPNRLSLRWLEEQVLPGIEAPVRLNLFGRTERCRQGGDSRIVEHGAVEDMKQVWGRCDLMVCPARVTAGVSVKLAEALYNRAPVLATTAAARGLPLEPDSSVMLLDEPQEWVNFLNSPAVWELAGKEVHEETRRKFSVGAWTQNLQRFVMDVLTGGQPTPQL